MQIPQEFADSFESQYPKSVVNVALPDVLDKFPQVKANILNCLEKYNTLGYIVEHDSITYDLLGMTYKNTNSKDVHQLSTHGYSIILEKAYGKLDTNKSLKMLEFVMDEVKELNVDMVNARLAVDIGNYFITKSIALVGSWTDYCLNNKNFEMNYEEYKNFIANM